MTTNALLDFTDLPRFDLFTPEHVTPAIAQLLDDARRYEGFGRERFVAACVGRSNPEILAQVAALAEQLGCRRPFIENIRFAAAR